MNVKFRKMLREEGIYVDWVSPKSGENECRFLVLKPLYLGNPNDNVVPTLHYTPIVGAKRALEFCFKSALENLPYREVGFAYFRKNIKYRRLLKEIRYRINSVDNADL